MTFDITAVAHLPGPVAPDAIHPDIELKMKVDANSLEAAIKVAKDWLELQRSVYIIKSIEAEGLTPLESIK